MSDEEALGRLAREAIAAERVPAGQPRNTWGGYGTGACCDICGLSISTHEIEFEVEFSRETAPARTYHLHTQCYAVWELERHAPGAELPHKRAGRPPALTSRPTPVIDGGHLSDPDKAGSMPDDEREPKDGRESS